MKIIHNNEYKVIIIKIIWIFSNNLVSFEQIKIDTVLANISWDDMVQRKEIKVWLVFPFSRERRRNGKTIKKKQHRYVTLFDVNAKLARASFIFRVTLFPPNYVPSLVIKHFCVWFVYQGVIVSGC